MNSEKLFGSPDGWVLLPWAPQYRNYARNISEVNSSWIIIPGAIDDNQKTIFHSVRMVISLSRLSFGPLSYHRNGQFARRPVLGTFIVTSFESSLVESGIYRTFHRRVEIANTQSNPLFPPISTLTPVWSVHGASGYDKTPNL